MKENKFLYSRCPYCKKHGIPAFEKFGKYTYEIKCIYCEHSFRVNFFVAILIKLLYGISLGIIGYLLNNYTTIHIPLWLIIFVFVIGYFTIQYFIPIHMIK